MGESRDIVSEVLRLDREGDHVGIFLYLKGRSYDPKEALYAVYRLMAGGRFQSAYIVAKLLASSALDNPTVDLARAVGGALFCNKEDEASGSARLAQSVGRLDAGGRQAFRDSVMGPVFRHALAEEVAGSDKELRSSLLRIRQAVLAEGDTLASRRNEGPTLVSVAADDRRINYYGRWRVGAPAVTINNGSEAEFIYTGNTCRLCFDVSTVEHAAYPTISYWIDNFGPTRATLTPTGTLDIAAPHNENARGRHHLRFVVSIYSGYPLAVDNWRRQANGVKFLGARLARGGDLLPLPYNPNQIEFLGDSLVASLGLLHAGSHDPAADAPELGWPEHAAKLLGMKAIVNGHGGQGITTTASDGAPAAVAAFPYVYAGVPWTPRNEPAVVAIYYGTNDRFRNGFTRRQYEELLSTVRSFYKDAAIFAINPNRSNYGEVILGTVKALGDKHIFALDYGAALTSADLVADGIHMNTGGAVELARRLSLDIQQRLGTPTSDNRVSVRKPKARAARRAGEPAPVGAEPKPKDKKKQSSGARRLAAAPAKPKAAPKIRRLR